jgi:HlyD family secretion protein
MNRSRFFRLAIRLVVVGGLVAALAGGVRAFSARPKDASTVVAVRQDVTESAVASGRVVAPSRIQIGVVQGGVVAEVPVDEGQRVKPGDLLLRLDDQSESASLAQARAAVAQARARLLEVTEVQRGRSVAALASAEAELVRARSQAERTRKLASSGASTPFDVEVADTALALAQAKRDAAAVDAHSNSDGGSQVRLAQAQLEAAQAARLVAEVRVAQTRIVALVEATVLQRDVEPGEVAFPGRALLVLGRSGGAAGAMEIVVEPDEKNLAVLRVGQEAACAADAYPDAPFAGVVKDISPLVDAGRGTVEVRLSVTDPPAFLRTDMTVSVEITTGMKKDALVMPREAVRDLATDAPFVLVLKDGVAVKTPVKLGARGAEMVEITNGLADSAVVVRDGQVKPGARVRSP